MKRFNIWTSVGFIIDAVDELDLLKKMNRLVIRLESIEEVLDVNTNGFEEVDWYRDGKDI